MYQNLHPPIHVIPSFVSDEHALLASKLGFVFGPLAHISTTTKGLRLKNFLVQIPRSWNKIEDTGISQGEKHGTYFADEKGRRRVRFGDMNLYYSAEAEVLCRYDIQHWFLGGGDWLWYVRKTIGGEATIHRYPHQHAHVVFEQKVHGFENDVEARRACQEWLEQHFPDWRNPLAYWDD